MSGLILYTSGDIGKVLGLARQTANVWVYRGKLPEPVAHTLSGTRLWSQEQVDQISADYAENIRLQEESKQARAGLEKVRADRKKLLSKTKGRM